MSDVPTVGAWVSVPDDCRMSFTLGEDEDTRLLLGEWATGFEVVLTDRSLDRLIETATTARERRVAAEAGENSETSGVSGG
ncbi:hypothetical protein [Actinokineospora spheciospongiae]|uniref:hypothetical protein n=1 Tax=Actinokineospora spheciospongiae TaxID=909613 RepID=UPI000D71D863|nr:hypothetical protein [Actinokineospora spheciospongiae]PWW64176.1 hypothetical protein DFQ13_103145 [Actinokineospora spheciospongiae]